MHVARISAVAALLLVFAAPALAQTNPTVANFNTLCFETRGDQTLAFERAGARGWSASRFDTAASRMKSDSEGRHTLMFTTLGNGNSLCMTSLANHRGPRADVSADMRTLIGHSPTYMDGAWSVWTFDNTGAELVWMANDDTQRATDAFNAGRAVVVRSGVDSGIDVVMYEFRPARQAATEP